jgi:hypothetical protein
VHAVTTRGDTALHLASNTETVVCLLEVGAELNRRNTVGAPAVPSIHRGNVPAVTELVQARARARMPAALSGGRG